MAIAPDGRWLATTGDEGTRLWEVGTGTLRHILTRHDGWVGAVAIAPDGSWLATAGGDAPPRVWEAATGALRYTMTHHADSAVAIAPDGRWLATTPARKGRGSGRRPPGDCATPSPTARARCARWLSPRRVAG